MSFSSTAQYVIDLPSIDSDSTYTKVSLVVELYQNTNFTGTKIVSAGDSIQDLASSPIVHYELVQYTPQFTTAVLPGWPPVFVITQTGTTRSVISNWQTAVEANLAMLSLGMQDAVQHKPKRDLRVEAMTLDNQISSLVVKAGPDYTNQTVKVWDKSAQQNYGTGQIYSVGNYPDLSQQQFNDRISAVTY